MSEKGSERLSWLFDRFSNIKITHDPTDMVVLRRRSAMLVITLDAIHAMNPREWLKLQQLVEELPHDDTTNV